MRVRRGVMRESIVDLVARGKLRARKIFSPNLPIVGKIDLYSLAPHCRICQREVFSKVSRGIRRLLKQISLDIRAGTADKVVLARDGRRGKRFEFCTDHRNVEAASPLAVDPPISAPVADLGSAARSGIALPMRLARPYPPLIFSPPNLSFCL